MIRLDGRVVVVTGAGHGLGRAYALELARLGARVVVNNRLRPGEAPGGGSADRTVAELRALGAEAVANHADVTDPTSGASLVACALTTWRRLDALVANAGVDQHTPFHRTSLAEFEAVFVPNFHGTLYAVHAAWPHFRDARHGRVVVSTSVAGLHGLHGLAAYSASKAALIGLMRALAQEGAARDVLCNAVAPYAVTRMTAGQLPPEVAATLAPERVAPLVAWLVSAECRLNGRTLVAGKGGVRRAATVEYAPLDYGPDGPSAEALAADAARLEAADDPREYADGLAAFADFDALLTGAPR